MEQTIIAEALIAFNDTTVDLLKTISMFSEEQFNQIPFEGSWTGGQVAEHLILSETGVATAVDGNTKDAERPADEKVATIKKVFLDFTVKFKTSEDIMPTDKPKDRNSLYAALKKNREAIMNTANRSDLVALCIDAPLPVIGELTRLEWLWFTICHSTRHIQQLKNIYSKVN